MACRILVWLGIKPVFPIVEMWSLNHWTTRELPPVLFFSFLFYNKIYDYISLKIVEQHIRVWLEFESGWLWHLGSLRVLRFMGIWAQLGEIKVLCGFFFFFSLRIFISIRWLSEAYILMTLLCHFFLLVCYLLSCVRLFAALQAPLFMEFSRQKYWSRLPFPSPGYLPDPGIEPGSLSL